MWGACTHFTRPSDDHLVLLKFKYVFCVCSVWLCCTVEWSGCPLCLRLCVYVCTPCAMQHLLRICSGCLPPTRGVDGLQLNSTSRRCSMSFYASSNGYMKLSAWDFARFYARARHVQIFTNPRRQASCGLPMWLCADREPTIPPHTICRARKQSHT